MIRGLPPPRGEPGTGIRGLFAAPGDDYGNSRLAPTRGPTTTICGLSGDQLLQFVACPPPPPGSTITTRGLSATPGGQLPQFVACSLPPGLTSTIRGLSSAPGGQRLQFVACPGDQLLRFVICSHLGANYYNSWLVLHPGGQLSQFCGLSTTLGGLTATIRGLSATPGANSHNSWLVFRSPGVNGYNSWLVPGANYYDSSFVLTWGSITTIRGLLFTPGVNYHNFVACPPPSGANYHNSWLVRHPRG